MKKIFFGIIFSFVVLFADGGYKDHGHRHGYHENDGYHGHHYGHAWCLNGSSWHWNGWGDSDKCNHSLVDDDREQCPTACYKKIQNAIDDASDNDTIKICKGDYNEAVTIDGKNNLTITNYQGTLPSDINWYHDTTVLTVGNTNGHNNQSDTIKVENLSMHLTSNSANERVIRLLKGKDFSIDNVKLVSDGGSAIYGDSGHFDGDNSFTNLTITSNGSGIRINKGDKQTFDTIDMTLKGNSGNDYGIYIGSNVTDKVHVFTHLKFNVKAQNALEILNGKDMSFEDINVTASGYSDNTVALYTGENVANDSSLDFKDINISLNAGVGFDIHKAEDTTFNDINVSGSSNWAILTRPNVKGKPTFKGINIHANANYGIYIQKGKDVDIEDANITGVSANGYVIRFGSNVEGNHTFKNITASTDALGIYIGKGTDVTFDTVKLQGTNASANDYGIETSQNVTGNIIVKNCDINVSGYAFLFHKGKPDINNSKFVSRGDKVIYFASNTNNIKMKNSCSYKESSSGNAYALYLANNDKNATVNNNCFYGSPLSNLALAYKKDNDFDGNFWQGLTATSYDYNHIKDNHPLSCPNSCGGTQAIIPTPINVTYYFDAWDTFRDINDRNISTKIVSKDFNLIIASLDKNGTKYKEFNGTVCSRIIKEGDSNVTDWFKNFFADNNTSDQTTQGNPDFNVSKALKKAKVEIIWKKNTLPSIECSTIDGFEDNETNSSDNFAIRPDRFVIYPPTQVYAGEDFNISYSAKGYGSDDNASDYNESNGSSFNLHVNEVKPVCKTGNFTGNVNFKDGNVTVLSNYDEVGKIDVNISDKDVNCSSRFAGVDCKDKNISGYWNSDINTSIDENDINFKVYPYEVNITDANFSNIFNLGEHPWIYMDNNIGELNVTSNVHLFVNNKQHKVLQDFNSSCYAKDVNVTFYYDVNNSNGDVNLTYRGSLTDNKKSIQDINKTLQIYKSDFINDGNLTKSYAFNVDRNYSKPLNPIFVNMKKVDVNLSKVKNENNKIIDDKNVTFYYGRIKTNDITTNKQSISNNIKIEIYDTNNSHHSDFNQDSLYWYEMGDDNGTGIISLIPQNDFIYTTDTNKSGIGIESNSSLIVKQGIASFDINNSWSQSDTAYVHIKIPAYLWYNKYSDYNDSNKSDCSLHPCFIYKYYSNSSANNRKNIKSGDFIGTTIGDEYNTSRTKMGVKIFR